LPEDLPGRYAELERSPPELDRSPSELERSPVWL